MLNVDRFYYLTEQIRVCQWSDKSKLQGFKFLHILLWVIWHFELLGAETLPESRKFHHSSSTVFVLLLLLT